MTSHINNAVETFRLEIETLEKLKNSIDENFEKACEIILENNRDKGRVIITGMGKSGHIGKKMAATFASTGTPAFFVHPGEAGHGDFGMITKNDVLIAISNSGTSSEIMGLMPMIKHLNIPIIAITSNPKSILARNSNVTLNLHVDKEACPLNLAPTSSTTATLVLGDALAIALLKAKNFSEKDFAFSHPNGALGRKLILKVENIMRKGNEIPIVKPSDNIRKAILEISDKGVGNTLVAENNTLLGIFTDGDLRRMFEAESFNSQRAISEVMTKKPKSISKEEMAITALEKMEKYEITSLAVVDNDHSILGIVTMHDLIKLELR
ncbi:KpsF/GutQ family sugar-phosphate isomerase [Francisella tularensis subsp. novicida]|uniref:KpsF/GutQ family sugar-phosphate isomerase n=1 Tax=Francisella tularensis TaxID=263 RepID=UPI0005048518|nr:KpsF/GutQ family sugar-phosphate isomerase [Francisella tularensis]AJJ47419.1 sugar isomerase, KpsF/GutQ family protein [Francisella tularensis subsp. novicida]KFJ66519.1 sugar isomerase, KpsF/GutQ family protein [Francisella tularensis subsp. novicida]MBK2343573.1 KpsF/GutQ family sugar-phosphate isomerase [Francisella tularensis subsp. novicida]MBK2348916.1 KpsF/GutQ family sugar-phosphate isomerase [Francisella tularensis subsp. novicida]MBK2352503.1 KpsF/GutQ family sugar-phosphate isom